MNIKTGALLIIAALSTPAHAMGLTACFGGSKLICDPEADSRGVKMCQYRTEKGSWEKVYRFANQREIYHHYPTNPNDPSGGFIRDCLK